MVLDLVTIKKELMDTQKEFNSTREVLKNERKEKKELLTQL